MKIYKVTCYVLDLNGNAETKEDVIGQIEANRYPEFLNVDEIEETEIPDEEWTDEHPMNQCSTDRSAWWDENK